MKAISRVLFVSILAVVLADCSNSGKSPDKTLPVITLVGANTQVIEAGIQYVELGATATDNRDGDLTNAIVIDAGNVDTAVPGNYVVTYDVSDSAGNSAVTATRTVACQDTTPPVITLLGDNPQIVIAGTPYIELGATAFDTLDGDLSAAIVVNADAVDTMVAGDYSVTYDVTDVTGNEAETVSRTVRVESPPPPQSTWYKDSDADGYADGTTLRAVERPVGYYLASELTATTGDCDDTNATVHPGGVEIDADGLDQDCNGFEISGPPEIVFDWTTDSCEDLDIPDLSARAFRDKNDQVQLISSHINVRRSIGPDLDSLVHDCTIVMSSHHDPDPAMFNDVEWIAATYTEDGETIYAIVHNEYEGWTHPGQCRTTRWTMDCWYNGLTLAVSTDVGLTYSHPVAPPLHLIAASSLQYEKDIGPSGIFAPTSIVKGIDGYYYAMAQRNRWIAPNIGEQWACLMRTADLADPDAWRFWDGDMFEGRFVNPYTDPVANSEDHDCAPIDRDNIADMHESLVYSEYLDRYILAGASQDGDQYGFFMSLSNDLINWTHRTLLLKRHLPWTVSDPSEPVHLYPSLLDPQSTSRNFETIGKTAYIYYSRNNRRPGDLDRDMLRVPIEFFRY
jgi:hypothetical protein